MKLKELVGGTIKSIFADDESDDTIIIVDTTAHGLRAVGAAELEIIMEDEFDDEI